jgi:archaemetzincin
MKKIIYLQRIGDIDPRILIDLQKNLKWFFKKNNIKINILPEKLPLLESEYGPYRRQYDASKVNKRLITHVNNKNYYRILGVMDVDISSRLLKKKHPNFLFGIADMPKNKFFGRALISVTRLREKFYRRSENLAQFELRVLKEAIHELGHTFGLKHCENLCVMRASNSLDDTDKKPSYFCEACLKKLNSFLEDID